MLKGRRKRLSGPAPVDGTPYYAGIVGRSVYKLTLPSCRFLNLRCMAAVIDRPFYKYPGNKIQNGLLQAIINTIPPHDGYLEPFLGSGAVIANKKPAIFNWGNDINQKISCRWQQLHELRKDYRFTAFPALQTMAVVECSEQKWLIYCDPPYLKETRRSAADIYDYEMTLADHVEFLNFAAASKHMIIISGYDCDVYNTRLKDWNKKTCKVTTRRGVVTETLWFNFQDPVVLHEYTYIGKGRTDRQRIKRKVANWVKEYEQLPELEKELIFQSLQKSRTQRKPVAITPALSVYK